MTEFQAITATGLSRSYGKRQIVADVDIALMPGQLTAILGGSGAGKSTLLRLLAGLERPDLGDISCGKTIWNDGKTHIPAEARKAAMIFQDFALFPHMNVIENVRFGLTALDRGDATHLARSWLARVRMSSYEKAFPHELSGGEQQRVAIARALAIDPVMVLMDEPFSGLDPALREAVRSDVLGVLKETGVPTLLVTHDPQEAMAFADRLGVMRNGRLVAHGTPEDVFFAPPDIETARALGPVVCLHESVVANSQLASPFGTVPARSVPDGTRAQLCCRENQLLVSDAANAPASATMMGAEFLGPSIRLKLDMDGTTISAVVPSGPGLPAHGARIGLRLQQGAGFVLKV